MRAPARKTPKRQKETVFLSGTDKVADVMAELYRALKRMGFTPWWHKKPDFPHFAPNAMDACIAAVEQCDRFILVLDERAGLPYKEKLTITEAEYNAAESRRVPILVFIRNKVWIQSRSYYKAFKANGKKLSEEQFRNLYLDGDQEVYALIDKLQHTERNGSRCVPWITDFEEGLDIVRAVRGKWVVPDKAQQDVITVLRRAADGHSAGVLRTRTAGTVSMSLKAQEEINQLSDPEKDQFKDVLLKMERRVLLKDDNPLKAHRATNVGVGNMVVLEAGKLYVKLVEHEDKNKFTIISVHRKDFRS